jgi:hypothetical protein
LGTVRSKMYCRFPGRRKLHKLERFRPAAVSCQGLPFSYRPRDPENLSTALPVLLRRFYWPAAQALSHVFPIVRGSAGGCVPPHDSHLLRILQRLILAQALALLFDVSRSMVRSSHPRKSHFDQPPGRQTTRSSACKVHGKYHVGPIYCNTMDTYDTSVPGAMPLTALCFIHCSTNIPYVNTAPVLIPVPKLLPSDSAPTRPHYCIVNGLLGFPLSPLFSRLSWHVKGT